MSLEKTFIGIEKKCLDNINLMHVFQEVVGGSLENGKPYLQGDFDDRSLATFQLIEELEGGSFYDLDEWIQSNKDYLVRLLKQVYLVGSHKRWRIDPSFIYQIAIIARNIDKVDEALLLRCAWESPLSGSVLASVRNSVK